MTLALYIIGILLLGWLVVSLAFAWLSLYQTLMDLPARLLAGLSERRERRERRRIARARYEQARAVIEAIRRHEL